MYVYIEYAIIDNFVINYLLIKTATKLCKVKTGFFLLILSSFLGTAISLLVPFFNVNDYFSILIKVLLAFLMTFVGGKYLTIKKYFITLLTFTSFTFLSGGFIIALFTLANIDYQNYFLLNYDSLIPIGLTVLLIYLISKTCLIFARKLLALRNLTPFLRNCIVVIDKKRFSVKGFIDSGNGLYDKKSGLPVIVCSNGFFNELKKVAIKKSVSTLLFDTVSGSSEMKLYVVDKLMIYNGVSVNIFNNVLLGVSPFGFSSNDYELLLHPSLIG